MLLNAAAAHAGAGTGLDWARLAAAAPQPGPGVTRIAVALLILGFGTKAGLAPLHAWLPDAHGQAPAPVSALMSGVLLSVAFYAILRVKAIADVALGAGFARVAARGRSRSPRCWSRRSLLIAAARLQADAGLLQHRAHGPARPRRRRRRARSALAAVLLHMLGHGLAKGSLFVSAGTDPAGHRHQPHRRQCAAWPPGCRCWPAAPGPACSH